MYTNPGLLPLIIIIFPLANASAAVCIFNLVTSKRNYIVFEYK